MTKISVLNFSTTSQHGQMVRVPDSNSGGHGLLSPVVVLLASSEFNSSIKPQGSKFFIQEPADN